MATDPNLVTVYSPDGEKFELHSRANAYDLVNHAGWKLSPTASSRNPLEGPLVEIITGVQPADAAVPVAAPVTAPKVVIPEVVEEDDIFPEGEEEVAPVVADKEEAPASDKITADYFADFGRPQVVEWIKARFPNAQYDGRLSLAKMIQLAVDLADADEA